MRFRVGHCPERSARSPGAGTFGRNEESNVSLFGSRRGGVDLHERSRRAIAAIDGNDAPRHVLGRRLGCRNVFLCLDQFVDHAGNCWRALPHLLGCSAPPALRATNSTSTPCETRAQPRFVLCRTKLKVLPISTASGWAWSPPATSRSSAPRCARRWALCRAIRACSPSTTGRCDRRLFENLLVATRCSFPGLCGLAQIFHCTLAYFCCYSNAEKAIISKVIDEASFSLSLAGFPSLPASLRGRSGGSRSI
jgi:hypothetical protein